MTTETALYVLVLSTGLFITSVSVLAPATAIGMWLAVYPLTANLAVPEGLDKLPANRLVTVLLFIVCLPRLMQQSVGRSIRIAFWIYGGFLLAAILSAATSSIPGDAVARAISYMEPLLWLGLGVVAVRGSKDGTNAILLGTAIGLVAVLAVAIPELILQANPLLVQGISRTTGDYMIDRRLGFSGRLVSTLGQPVYAGLYAVVGISAVAGLIAIPRIFLERVVLVCLGLLTAVFTFLTGTRGALIGMLLLVPTYLLYRGKRIAMLLVTALIFVSAIFAIRASNPTSEFLMDSVVVDSGGTASMNVLGRLLLTRRMLGVFLQHPLLGVGPGFFQKTSTSDIADVDGLGGVENQYATVLAENGILGGLLLVAFLGFLVFQLAAQARRHGDPRVAWTGAALSVLAVVAVSCSVLSAVPMYLAMALTGGGLSQGGVGTQGS